MVPSSKLVQLVPVVLAAGYVGYVVQDRFKFHDQVREDKIRQRKERQAEEVAAARAGLPPPPHASPGGSEKKFRGW